MQKVLEGTKSKKVKDEKMTLCKILTKNFDHLQDHHFQSRVTLQETCFEIFLVFFREKKIGGGKNAKNDEGGCQSIKVIKKSPNEDSSFPENSSHLCAQCVGGGGGGGSNEDKRGTK